MLEVHGGGSKNTFDFLFHCIYLADAIPVHSD